MLLALLGGALIGLAASLAYAGERQVLGVSGQLGALLRWRMPVFGFGAWFVLGLLAGGLVMARLAPQSVSSLPERSLGWLLASGLLVGFGTRLGSGCTSGHGVCGISRLSLRSLVATGIFIATGALAVAVTRHWLGGAG